MKTNKIKEIKCCFIGHRTIKNSVDVHENLISALHTLMTLNPLRTFLFGSRSEFNDICHTVVTELKESYPEIKRIKYTCKNEGICLESERIKTNTLASKLFNKTICFQGYEEEHRSDHYLMAGKAAYIERNKSMIDDSDICIFYYDNNYLTHKSRSGTAMAYNYAIKLSKKQNGHPKIINLFAT